MATDGPLLATHAYSAANWLAMHCRRHMHLYGTTKEQLGALAINSRRNAGLNPLAALRDPLTMEDYLSARTVSTPSPPRLRHPRRRLHRRRRVARRPRARLPEPADPDRGHGRRRRRATGWVSRPDYPRMASVEAAAQMWSRTDLTAADLDVAELYDGFTFLTLAWLEALGICAEGEGGPFLEGGSRIALDGELPLNTYGGQLSAGRMHGYWVLHEAVCSCVGWRAPGRCADAEVAVVSNGGGPIAGCMLLTR